MHYIVAKGVTFCLPRNEKMLDHTHFHQFLEGEGERAFEGEWEGSGSGVGAEWEGEQLSQYIFLTL